MLIALLIIGYILIGCAIGCAILFYSDDCSLDMQTESIDENGPSRKRIELVQQQIEQQSQDKDSLER